MILFWFICGLLVIIALAFILPPLLQRPGTTQAASDKERREANIEIYRDQLAELEADLHNGIVSKEQYEQDRQEIERRLLEDVKLSESEPKTAVDFTKRNVVYALAIGLPLVAVLFYLKVGELKALAPSEMQRPAAQPTSQMRSQEQIEANVSALVERLKSNPNDAEGWVMLARSYNSMKRFGEAAGAYARATELQPDNADLWAEYAFVSAMANNRSLEGQPMELVNKALKLDTENLKALQLAGNDAFQRKDYKKAIDYWSRVLKKVPAQSEVAQSIQQRIDEAKSLAKTK
ncbi:MAG TPA: c-type cytochrome biogenesis protein CcmI [Pyrinomonadaceae bacterium]|nr:c-type cytochrome biogenesis protein CcmI [Pyrinomonadaceae bacterium]